MSIVKYKHFIVSNKIKEVVCGERTYRYYVGKILRTPFPLEPTPPNVHDFRTCPQCQKFRTQLIDSMRDKYHAFPDCCESHKKLRSLSVFKKSDYNNAHVQCADSIIFCYDHIKNFQDGNYWQVDIKNYLYRAVYRFGCIPTEYGGTLFLDVFDTNLRSAVSTSPDIRPEVKRYVNIVLDEYIHRSAQEERDPIEELLHIYNNWLNAFPFDLPEFSSVKKEFAMRTPLTLMSVEENYSKQVRRLPTNKELVTWLNKQSKEFLGLFKQMRNSSGITQAMYNSYELSFKTKQLNIRESRLLDEYMDEEEGYLHTLTEWFEIQIELIDLMCTALPKQEGIEEENSYKEAHRRIDNLKTWIEEQNGCKILPSEKETYESYLQILFKGVNTIASSSYRFDREVGNGRGFVDFIVTKGSNDGTIVEFKMATNSNLSDNLKCQVPVYKKSNQINNAITVIFYFSNEEFQHVKKILKKQKRLDDKDIILIDCSGNKLCASKLRRKEDI